MLFTLIAKRYERRSLGITSNLVSVSGRRCSPIPMATAAVIDRIVHHSVILESTCRATGPIPHRIGRRRSCRIGKSN